MNKLFIYLFIHLFIYLFIYRYLDNASGVFQIFQHEIFWPKRLMLEVFKYPIIRTHHLARSVAFSDSLPEAILNGK